jgi:hypothetical protein
MQFLLYFWDTFNIFRFSHEELLREPASSIYIEIYWKILRCKNKIFMEKNKKERKSLRI